MLEAFAAVKRGEKTPAGVMNPMWLASSTYHRLLSRPTTKSSGNETPAGIGYSVIAPWSVIRPILLPVFWLSRNHSELLGPATIELTPAFAVGTLNST